MPNLLLRGNSVGTRSKPFSKCRDEMSFSIQYPTFLYIWDLGLLDQLLLFWGTGILEVGVGIVRSLLCIFFFCIKHMVCMYSIKATYVKNNVV